jgi:DNA polymerase I-like protein with 3'-5' exonuclease and polymerase domains
VSGAHCPEHDQATLAVRLECPLCREYQKTVTYAFLFGAGNKRIGEIVGRSPAYGSKVKGAMQRRLAGGGKDFDAALDAAFSRKYVTLMDGRRAPTNSRHDTLNTLLMGSEAVSMKHALVEADWMLKGLGLVPSEETTDALDNGDYEFVANIHDEWQVTCRPEIAETVGKALTDAIASVGSKFELACPLKGSYKVGKTWAETH